MGQGVEADFAQMMPSSADTVIARLQAPRTPKAKPPARAPKETLVDKLLPAMQLKDKNHQDGMTRAFESVDLVSQARSNNIFFI